MSGGHFGYSQYRINDIADSIQEEIDKNGRPLTEEEKKDYYYDAPFESHYEYPQEVIEEFKKGVMYLRIAAIYAQRIDWLLSGDDGEETFMEHLNKELTELNNSGGSNNDNNNSSNEGGRNNTKRNITTI